jgi:hypothetical protein
MATDLEAIPEEVDVIAERQKVPKEEAAAEAVAAWKDQRPAVVCQKSTT